MSIKTTIIAGIVSMTTLMTAGLALAEDWPNLPTGIKNGIAARVDNRLIVGLGTAGADIFALDLDNRAAGWEKLSPFDGAAPSQPAAAVSNGILYVFSGSGKVTEDAASPIVFDTVHSYDAAANTWKTLDTTTPVGLLGASAMTLPDGRIVIVGGYNKGLFDKYLSDVLSVDKDAEPDRWNKIVADFMGMEPKDYHWNNTTLVYDPAANSWSDLGENPYLPNTGSAVVETAPGSYVVINGEIKPGLRTDEAKSLMIDANGAKWAQIDPVPAPEGADVQEGLAGAYAGAVNGAVLLTGGANFPGARAKAGKGEWFAHEGLSKQRAAEVFILDQGKWQQVGMLAEGLAYGASFTVDEGVLIVGGEDNTGAARDDVFVLSWDGKNLTRID